MNRNGSAFPRKSRSGPTITEPLLPIRKFAATKHFAKLAVANSRRENARNCPRKKSNARSLRRTIVFAPQFQDALSARRDARASRNFRSKPAGLGPRRWKNVDIFFFPSLHVYLQLATRKCYK